MRPSGIYMICLVELSIKMLSGNRYPLPFLFPRPKSCFLASTKKNNIEKGYDVISC